MKKHFTTGQIKWIIAIFLIVSFIVNIPYIIKEVKEGANRPCLVEVKK